MKTILALPLLTLPLLFACQSSGGSGAVEGATRGAFYGAVSSGVVAAVFGGDVSRVLVRSLPEMVHTQPAAGLFNLHDQALRQRRFIARLSHR